MDCNFLMKSYLLFNVQGMKLWMTDFLFHVKPYHSSITRANFAESHVQHPCFLPANLAIVKGFLSSLPWKIILSVRRHTPMTFRNWPQWCRECSRSSRPPPGNPHLQRLSWPSPSHMGVPEQWRPEQMGLVIHEVKEHLSEGRCTTSLEWNSDKGNDTLVSVPYCPTYDKNE